MGVCDFRNSYMMWTGVYNPNDTRKPGHMPWPNSARIELEARCEVTDDRSGETDEFFLIAPCRAEWMYRNDIIFFRERNHEYCAIASRTQYISIGYATPFEDDIQGLAARKKGESVQQYFKEFSLTVRDFPCAQPLEDEGQVIEATVNNLALVGRTEIKDEEKNMSAMIEYPIKTNNIQPEHKRFQVDTGPVPFPDFKQATDSVIDSFEVAHVCYNTFDIAEFVLRVPTPMPDEENEACRVVHYSDFRRMSARNTVFAIPSN